MALSYRDDLNGKYEFAQLHLPIYNANQEGVVLMQSKAANNYSNKRYVANAHSGIFIVKTDPANFLENTFKMDPSICTGSPATATFTPNLTAPNPTTRVIADGSIVPVMNLIEGVNITGHLIASDTFVQKETTSFERPEPYLTYDYDNADAGSRTTAANVTGSFIAETQINGIIGEDTAENSLDSGYYQTEISFGAPASDIRGKLINNNKVMGIIGRFYNSQSYTQSVESEGAIPYVHESDDPLPINSLRVRILDPDGKLASNLNSDNTIFMEVISQKPSAL